MTMTPPPVTYRNKTLKEITLVPRPLTRPVECWQPIFSASPRGIEFMLKHGIKGVVPGAGTRSMEIAQRWQEAQSSHGRETELGEGLTLVLQIHFADTVEQAQKEADLWFEEQLKVLAPLGRMPQLREEQILATYDPESAPKAGLPTVQDLVADDAWIRGPPEHVVYKLREIQEKYPGLERVSVGAGALAIPPSVLRQEIETFGQEVMPKFPAARR